MPGSQDTLLVGKQAFKKKAYSWQDTLVGQQAFYLQAYRRQDTFGEMCSKKFSCCLLDHQSAPTATTLLFSRESVQDIMLNSDPVWLGGDFDGPIIFSEAASALQHLLPPLPRMTLRMLTVMSTATYYSFVKASPPCPSPNASLFGRHCTELSPKIPTCHTLFHKSINITSFLGRPTSF